MPLRADQLARIKDKPDVSVLIIGAGINGIGTFRDLALQGVDVVLVDRGDFCSGASAASSHMVHGGIRYLENGEFRLVREAVQERNRLIENTPHLVKPLPTTFPIFKWFSGLFNAPLKFLGLLDKPAERGAVVIKLGMMLYDTFTRKQKTVPKHVFRNQRESLALFPELNPEVRFTGTYFDGAMPTPERIAIELLQDAAAANQQALAVNYVSLVSAAGNTVTLKDEVGGETFQLTPKIVVNAAGPWIDLVNQSMGKQTQYISGTKGSHLILDHPALRQAIGENEFFFENKDGRIVLIYPLGDKVMVGTSDIRVDHPDDSVITDDEVDYFFDLIKRVFPKIRMEQSQIIYTFSGVRPLQRTEGGTTGQISRDHAVKFNESGDLLDVPVFSLVGGKWTSFRAFSEQATDQILAHMGTPRRVSTANLQIGGSKGYPKNPAEKTAWFKRLLASYPIEERHLEQLFQTHGTRVELLLKQVGAEAGEMLGTLPETSIGELIFILSSEAVVHLDDLILRRTMLGKTGKVNPDSLREIAQICAGILGWSEQQTEQEIERFTDLLRRKHKMNFSAYIRG
ncbi:MAG TPA: FAD-dependent oxidoreductase [Chloroflexi bacterium]|nr:FAD-dependent oxidoreductase [Chloroflexota bacterium]